MTVTISWYDALGRPIFDYILVPLSDGLFGYFGLGIIAFTLIVRLVLLPITIKQFRAARDMQWKIRALKPRLEEIKQAYKTDRMKRGQETMAAYREAGISPLGCLTSPMTMSMVIQMPILIAMIAAVRYASRISDTGSMVRIVEEGLSPDFFWLDLAERDTTFVLPLLVAVTMVISQRIMPPPDGDVGRLARLTRNVTLVSTPLVFFWLCAVNPSGLALYWFVSTLVNLGIQYYIVSTGDPELAIATSPSTKEPDPPGSGIPSMDGDKTQVSEDSADVSRMQENKPSSESP